MGNDTRYFVNATGDSIVTDSVYTNHSWGLESFNEFDYSYEYYSEYVKFDSALTIATRLKAGLTENNRTDFIKIIGADQNSLSSVFTVGIAANLNTLDGGTSDYYDTLALNNIIYTDLYSTIGNNNLTLFISPNYSLVGFALKTDTFNLVN